MAKDVVKPKDQRERLVNEILPASLSKIEEVLKMEVWQEETDEETGVVTKKLNARLLSLQCKTANNMVNAVIHLEDIALRRKAGSQLEKVLAALKAEKPDVFMSAKDRATKLIEAQPVSANSIPRQ